jgi:hypothetical protein
MKARLIVMPRPEAEPEHLRQIRLAAETRARQKKAERFLEILFGLIDSAASRTPEDAA